MKTFKLRPASSGHGPTIMVDREHKMDWHLRARITQLTVWGDVSNVPQVYTLWEFPTEGNYLQDIEATDERINVAVNMLRQAGFKMELTTRD